MAKSCCVVIFRGKEKNNKACIHAQEERNYAIEFIVRLPKLATLYT